MSQLISVDRHVRYWPKADIFPFRRCCLIRYDGLS